MKSSPEKGTGRLRRTRWFLAVAIGLGVGWAMSKSLGPAVGFSIGGGITLAFLAWRRDC